MSMDLVFIARVLDGLSLVETWETSSLTQANQLKSQAKQILKKVGSSHHDRCSVDVNGSQYVFHYILADGICYMVLAQQAYPKKLAFVFLEEIKGLFYEELKREFGTGAVDFRSQIETIEKPYYFIKFERTIQRKRHEYRDPQNNTNLRRIDDALHEVQDVMRKNLDDMLEKGSKLESLDSRAHDLRGQAKMFSDKAKILSLQALVKQYAAVGIIVFVLLVIFYLKFF